MLTLESVASSFCNIKHLVRFEQVPMNFRPCVVTEVFPLNRETKGNLEVFSMARLNYKCLFKPKLSLYFISVYSVNNYQAPAVNQTLFFKTSQGNPFRKFAYTWGNFSTNKQKPERLSTSPKVFWLISSLSYYLNQNQS